jgi:hypothetical protein
LPTAHVAFELVLRHIIAEWGVQPKTDSWAEILDASQLGWGDRTG